MLVRQNSCMCLFVLVLDDFTAYQFVKRYDSDYPRPVVVIGALAEPICDKLVIEYGNSFARCLPGECELIFAETNFCEKFFEQYF